MTAAIARCDIPADALIARYLRPGVYADCYSTQVEWPVSHARFVEAFYTTALFKAERLVLRWLAARPSSDAGARSLAEGDADVFAMWRVEGRAKDQVLLADFTGRTRSWLMVRAEGAGSTATRLYFGSAVVPRRRAGGEEGALGWRFASLLGFHKLYSRALLAAARRRLTRLR